MTTASEFGQVQAVLFDLDGTLADTAPDLAEAANRMRRDRGMAEKDYDLLRPVASMGARGILGVSFNVTPADSGYEALRREFLANYAEFICVHSRLFPGVRELLASLRERSIAYGIVTNKAQNLAIPLVRALGFGDDIVVVGGDTTAHAKPHPLPLLHAAALMNVTAERCVYVGDDERDITAGNAAGMTTVAAAWGYCAHSDPATWGADYMMNAPSELEAAVRASVLASTAP